MCYNFSNIHIPKQQKNNRLNTLSLTDKKEAKLMAS
jgi:hypothetical protein